MTRTPPLQPGATPPHRDGDGRPEALAKSKAVEAAAGAAEGAPLPEEILRAIEDFGRAQRGPAKLRPALGAHAALVAAIRAALSAEKAAREKAEADRDEAHAFATEVREALGEDYAGPVAHWRGRSLDSIRRVRAERDSFRNGQGQVQATADALYDSCQKYGKERGELLAARDAAVLRAQEAERERDEARAKVDYWHGRFREVCAGEDE